MKDSFDLLSLFSIESNDDLKRFEFNSLTNAITSYTVGYHECDNLDDAKIAVYKAIKGDLERKGETLESINPL